MKKVHKAGIPCGSKEKSVTYTHVDKLVTCDKCLNPKKEKTPSKKQDDRAGNKTDSK